MLHAHTKFHKASDPSLLATQGSPAKAKHIRPRVAPYSAKLEIGTMSQCAATWPMIGTRGAATDLAFVQPDVHQRKVALLSGLGLKQVFQVHQVAV